MPRKGEKVLHAMKAKYGGVRRTHPDSSHHSPPTRAMLEAHKTLREEVAGGLRSFTFDRFRADQQTPPYRD